MLVRFSINNYISWNVITVQNSIYNITTVHFNFDCKRKFVELEMKEKRLSLNLVNGKHNVRCDWSMDWMNFWYDAILPRFTSWCDNKFDFYMFGYGFFLLITMMDAVILQLLFSKYYLFKRHYFWSEIDNKADFYNFHQLDENFDELIKREPEIMRRHMKMVAN